MARLAMRVKDERRRKDANRTLAKRIALREKSVDLKLSLEDRQAAQVALQKLPKNSAPARVRNRCKLTGRPRGFMGKFGLSRNEFRRLASFGLIPGVTKASW